MSVSPQKIRIVGSVGSGKTTLAKALSKELQIPYFELDNVVWKRVPTGEVKRTEQERNDYLSSLIESNCWIIDGVHFQDWALHTFDRSELVIFLDPAYLIRVFRITLRYMKQISGKEASHYEPTFKIFKDMFKWNHDYEYQTKPKLLSYLEKNEMNYVLIKNEKDLKRFLHSIKSMDKRRKRYANE